MRIENQFYYTQETSEARYGDIPTNALNVARLLEGRPAWQQPFGTTLLHKKKLFVTQNLYTETEWLDVKNIIFIKHFFDTLEKEGFEIFYLKGDQFTQCHPPQSTEKLAELLKVLPDAIKNDVLSAAMKLANVPEQHIKKIDKAALRELQETLLDSVSATGLDWPDRLKQPEKIDLLGIRYDTPSLDAYWATRTEPLTALFINELAISSIFIDFLRKSASALKELALHACEDLITLEKITLEALEELYLPHSIITANNLAKLLSRAPQLKKLMLRSCKNLADTLSTGITLAALEELDLSHSSITANNLAALLSHAPQLKKLTLRSCTNLADTLSTGITLAALEELDLTNSTITANNLAKLLSRAPQLKKLMLRSCKNLADTLSTGITLAALEELDLSHSSITANNLAALLSHAPQLKKLTLRSCTNLADTLSTGITLAALEELDLTNSTITANNLAALLSHAPQLKKLMLHVCKNLEDSLSTGITLAALEELTLTNSTTTANNLAALLSHAPQLKKLKLHGCTNLADTLSTGITLATLEELTLSHSTITANNFAALLSHAPQLKKLKLHDCTNLADTLSTGITLVALEELDLSHSSITANNLAALLSHAPQLKKLTLYSCKNLADTLSTGITLAALEELDLSHSTITANNFAALLSHAPQLKKLMLHDCTNLADTLSTGITLAALKELDLSSSFITVTILSKLLTNTRQLRHLNLQNCNIQGDAAEIDTLLRTVKKNNPSIEILFDSSQTTTLIAQANTENVEATADHVSKMVSSARVANTGHAASKPASTHNISHQETMDANTTYANKKLNVTAVFFAVGGADPKPVNQYRLTTFDTASTEPGICRIDDAFKRSNSPAVKLQACTAAYTDINCYKLLLLASKLQDDRYYGKTTISLSTEWTSLPSLSPHETLLRYRIPGVADDDVEVHYSERDSLYYIRLTAAAAIPKSVDIEFILTIPKPSAPTIKLPDSILEIVQYCQDFGVGTLTLPKRTLTGPDYLAALKTQKRGACRHRAFVFKAMMQEKHPTIPVRIVENECHAFVEINIDGHWITQDLGGYPATLIVDDSNKPSLVSGSRPPQPVIMQLTETGVAIAERQPYFIAAAATQPAESMSHYAQQLLASSSRNTLIKVSGEQDSASLRIQLAQYCQHTHHPYFYVHKPEDLLCSSDTILRGADNTGTVKSGPGGSLHDFLMRHAADGTKPVLIVNYDNFTSADLVRFNMLLDTERKADGTPLPSNMKVIGLFNPNKPGAYTGTDFSSRFDHDDAMPALPALPTSPLFFVETANIHADIDASTAVIELFGGESWESILLGHWDIRNDTLFFIEGELSRAIASGKTNFILSNAPWDDDTFIQFWQFASLRKEYTYYGKTVVLPDSFSVQKKQGYDLEKHRTRFVTTGSDGDRCVLNPATFSQFLGEYACTENGLLSVPGIVENKKGSVLSVYLTHTLSDDAWAALLSLCEKHHVTLDVVQASDVTVPAALNVTPHHMESRPSAPWQGLPAIRTSFCYSTDPDTTVAAIKDAVIIDISELTVPDLIEKIAAIKKTEGVAPGALPYQFEKQLGVLTKLLLDGKTVVLTGTLSNEIAQYLSAFVLRRAQDTAAAGTLLIVGKNTALSLFMPAYQHVVTVAEKRASLPNLTLLSDAEIAKRSLAELRAIDRHHRSHPTAPPDAAWSGMEKLPPVDFTRLASKSAAVFDESRLAAVHTALADSSFVFLGGMTGVGKTTFVEKVWGRKPVYTGEDNIRAWAMDKTPGIKILFIDEANISSRQWSEFEGLFQTPKHIVIGNELIVLTDEHKIIFAGNPLSYGDERQMPSLFKRHGNSVVFEPMPPAYIAEKMLMPALVQIASEAHKKLIVDAITAFSTYMTQISTDNVLITPRELTMMALLTANYVTEHKINDPEKIKQIARYYAYTLSHAFVPSEKTNKFDKAFKENDIHTTADRTDHHVLINDTNRLAYHALNDFLHLRKSRQGETIAATGGLGGLIIEGEPGTGKSELVIQQLIKNGLHEKKFRDAFTKDRNAFYRMPVSMSLDNKKRMLIQAFFEGSVIVLDEFNSAPMMERFLNSLLMGQIPNDPDIKNQVAEYEKQGHKPLPGFMLLATQNPAKMGGRNKESSAVLHRMHKVVMGNYTEAETIAILEHKGLPKQIAIDMAADYFAVRKTNKAAICFRDLLKYADIEIKKIKMHQPAASLDSDPVTIKISNNAAAIFAKTAAAATTTTAPAAGSR